MKFGTLAQIVHVPGADRKNFQFFKKTKKSQKSRYHSNGLTDLREIWHHYAKWTC